MSQSRWLFLNQLLDESAMALHKGRGVLHNPVDERLDVSRIHGGHEIG
jgi:hypothetical protein